MECNSFNFIYVCCRRFCKALSVRREKTLRQTYRCMWRKHGGVWINLVWMRCARACPLRHFRYRPSYTSLICDEKNCCVEMEETERNRSVSHWQKMHRAPQRKILAIWFFIRVCDLICRTHATMVAARMHATAQLRLQINCHNNKCKIIIINKINFLWIFFNSISLPDSNIARFRTALFSSRRFALLCMADSEMMNGTPA